MRDAVIDPIQVLGITTRDRVTALWLCDLPQRFVKHHVRRCGLEKKKSIFFARLWMYGRVLHFFNLYKDSHRKEKCFFFFILKKRTLLWWQGYPTVDLIEPVPMGSFLSTQAQTLDWNTGLDHASSLMSLRINCDSISKTSLTRGEFLKKDLSQRCFSDGLISISWVHRERFGAKRCSGERSRENRKRRFSDSEGASLAVSMPTPHRSSPDGRSEFCKEAICLCRLLILLTMTTTHLRPQKPFRWKMSMLRLISTIHM